jgi:hypothetical protein
MNFRSIPVMLLTAAAALNADAQDRQFVRTYQSLTLPKGAKDIEIWNTFRTGRKYFYTRLDQRLEFETGLTDRLQTAVYLNGSHISQGSYFINSAGEYKDTLGHVEHESEFSFSNEWKYKLSDPVANRIGSAIYGEVSLSPDEVELEAKLILDKKIDKHLFALNLVGEWEFEMENDNGEVEFEMEEMPIELDLAYMYNFKPNFGLGLEAVYNNEFEKEHEGMELEQSALFAGPTLFWSGEKAFIILNVLPQISNLHKTDDYAGGDESLNLVGYEKMDVRLLFGFSF